MEIRYVVNILVYLLLAAFFISNDAHMNGNWTIGDDTALP